MGRKKGGRGKKKKRGANKKLTSGNEPEKQDDRLTLPPFSGYQKPLILSVLDYDEDDEDDLADVVPFGIGTRVEIDDDCLPEGVRTVGTVTGHGVEVAFNEREGVAHTSIRTDCGRPIHVMAEVIDCIMESDAPPLRPIYKVGSRIECKLQEDGRWVPGTIVNVYPDWVEKNWYPYRIIFDDGNSRPFWGPQDCIRSCSKTLSRKKRPVLRFKPGDRVSCHCRAGEGVWLDGTVVRLWCRRWEAAADYVAPYQIQLDEGGLIYAPADSDECIMRSAAPAPECWICFDNEQSESNLIIRGCVCRGTNNGFVHMDCLVKLAQTKLEERDPDPENEVNPFYQCITCKARFTDGSPCRLALAEAGYEAYKNRELTDIWNRKALPIYAGALASEGRFDDALKLLNERIALLRVVVAHATIEDGSPFWRLDLANLLLDLAKVYDKMERLPEMKAALDESLSITGSVQEAKLVDHRDSVLYLLAKYEYGTGDKSAALERLEEATGGDSVDLDTLLSCGNLNLECGNKERGLEQLSRAVCGLSMAYGSDSSTVCKANKYIQSIEQGIMEKFPSHGLRVIV